MRRPRGSSTWLRLSGDAEDIEDGGATCPCGGVPCGATLDRCCGPLVRNEVLATTAEQLLRSRYTAQAVAAGDHLFHTWDPSSRPSSVEPDPWVRWCSLEVLDVRGGGPGDADGLVEYRAQWAAGEGATVQYGLRHDRSRFTHRDGRWLYVATDPVHPLEDTCREIAY